MKIKLTSIIVFLLSGSFIVSNPPAYAAGSEHPIISRITIRGTDIFDLETNPKLNRFPYPVVNFLHIQTKEHIIRQELLFAEGDPMDVFLLRETERNLRGLSFIRAARVVSFPQRDGTVALVVHVDDAWTTEPQFNASGTGGETKVEIGFKEKNFLGLGKSVEYFHEKKEDVKSDSVAYYDPHVLGSRWQFKAQNIEATNGSHTNLNLQRPFYATDVRWSGQMRYADDVDDIEQFSNNIKVSEIRQIKETSEGGIGTKLGHSREVVNHVSLRYQKQNINYERTSDTTIGQVLPENETRQTVFLDGETFRNNFIEVTQLEKMTRIEDINLGTKIKVSPGYSPHDLTGRKSSTVFSGEFEKYGQIGKEDILYSLLSYSSRNSFESAKNERFNFNLKYFHRWWGGQTLVFNNRVEWGEDLDPDNLIELGNENGLRAFKNVAFRGSKSWVVNVESRSYFFDDLWNVLSVGGAVFFDSGYVWEPGQTVALSDMRSDAGAGLRFGLTRSSNEVVLRMDMAYRMQTLHGDPPGWVFTFGSGQAF